MRGFGRNRCGTSSSGFSDLKNKDLSDSEDFEPWWDPNLESIGQGAAAVNTPTGFLQQMAKNASHERP